MWFRSFRIGPYWGRKRTISLLKIGSKFEWCWASLVNYERRQTKIESHQIQHIKEKKTKAKEKKMGMKLHPTAIALLLLLASAAELSDAALYDVTKYGGKPDGKTDLSQVMIREGPIYSIKQYVWCLFVFQFWFWVYVRP